MRQLWPAATAPAQDLTRRPKQLTHVLIEREGAEVHGLGETALPPVPTAVGNALGSLGIHVTDLPMTPETVLAAVDRRGAGRQPAPRAPETPTER